MLYAYDNTIPEFYRAPQFGKPCHSAQIAAKGTTHLSGISDRGRFTFRCEYPQVKHTCLVVITCCMWSLSTLQTAPTGVVPP